MLGDLVFCELDTLELFINSDRFVLGDSIGDEEREDFFSSFSFGVASICTFCELVSAFRLSLEIVLESSEEEVFVLKPSDKWDILDKLLELSDSFSELEETADSDDKDEPINFD